MTNKPLPTSIDELQAAYTEALSIAWETPLDTAAFRQNRLKAERLQRALAEAVARERIAARDTTTPSS